MDVGSFYLIFILYGPSCDSVRCRVIGIWKRTAPSFITIMCREKAITTPFVQPHNGADRDVFLHGARPGDGGVPGEGEAHLPPRLWQDQHVRGE